MIFRNFFPVGGALIAALAAALTPPVAGAAPGPVLGTWSASSCTYGVFNSAAFGPGSGGAPAMVQTPLTIRGVGLAYWRRLGDASISPGSLVAPWLQYDSGRRSTTAAGCTLPFSTTVYTIPSLPATYESEVVVALTYSGEVDNLMVRIPSTQKLRLVASSLSGGAVVSYDGIDVNVPTSGVYDLGTHDGGVGQFVLTGTAASTTTGNFRIEAWPAELAASGSGSAVWRAPGAVSSHSFSLSNPASVTVRVLDGGGSVVRTLVSSASHTGGTVSAIWDGRTASGSLASDGRYVVRATSSDPSAHASSADSPIALDGTSPAVAATPAALTGRAQLILRATDAGSGVSSSAWYGAVSNPTMQGAAEPVSGVWSFSSDADGAQVAAFTPTLTWATGTYTVTTGVADRVGNSVAAPIQFSAVGTPVPTPPAAGASNRAPVPRTPSAERQNLSCGGAAGGDVRQIRAIGITCRAAKFVVNAAVHSAYCNNRWPCKTKDSSKRRFTCRMGPESKRFGGRAFIQVRCFLGKSAGSSPANVPDVPLAMWWRYYRG